MTLLAVALVAAVLVFAIVRPRGLPEIVVAAPAAFVAVASGLVPLGRAADTVRELAPTVAFLAAILVVGHLADAHGVFRWTAALFDRRAGDSPRAMLRMVFVAATAVTAVLSLDATVVLLTPIVVAAARRAGMDPRPHSYATVHLANSASLLLPVSNLTNLLAFGATGLTFVGFAATMALPWLVVLVVQFVVVRVYFRDALTARPAPPAPQQSSRPAEPTPVFALTVLAFTLAGFAVSGAFGVEPVWVALAAAIVLGSGALHHGTSTPRRIVRAADVWFCLFVLALGVVVDGVSSGTLGSALAEVLPSGTSWGALLAVAVVAALASNALNNLPATLLLLAALGPTAEPALILALLIGVNLGPNLTYVGSLATMLWRRISALSGEPVQLSTFTAVGVISTPLALVAAVTALWLVT
ncbi:arsenic transporter [Rhodococcus rhodnii]|uniref:Arsenic efflux pump protein n=2 Tax=Rhodococcus rhodnii TaxID=38312 RepID=R7WL80_9NOCA|nr:ArsB/NhaD family transporter [Rhodococcus rhodnii]EOM76058.1 arsenic efflux pump protein [Rhodococcus rhodnii LMG 5362]TXG91458.1 arsenic transporter [Rhodococcus rhodnii]